LLYAAVQHKMGPVVTVVEWSVFYQSWAWTVNQSWTDRDAVRGTVDSGAKEHVLGGAWIPALQGTIWGDHTSACSHCPQLIFWPLFIRSCSDVTSGHLFTVILFLLFSLCSVYLFLIVSYLWIELFCRWIQLNIVIYYFILLLLLLFYYLHCFDTVGWASGRASNL